MDVSPCKIVLMNPRTQPRNDTTPFMLDQMIRQRTLFSVRLLGKMNSKISARGQLSAQNTLFYGEKSFVRKRGCAISGPICPSRNRSVCDFFHVKFTPEAFAIRGGYHSLRPETIPAPAVPVIEVWRFCERSWSAITRMEVGICTPIFWAVTIFYVDLKIIQGGAWDLGRGGTLQRLDRLFSCQPSQLVIIGNQPQQGLVFFHHAFQGSQGGNPVSVHLPHDLPAQGFWWWNQPGGKPHPHGLKARENTFLDIPPDQKF